MKPLIIVQCRARSTRFPDKWKADICGKPMLARVVERARAADVGDVVVATGADAANDPIKEWCIDNQVRCLAPDVPEDDVLARFVRVAETCGAQHILRVTADCPLIDPAGVREVAERLVVTGDAYATNAYPGSSWPEGMDCEGLQMWALELADRHTVTGREHVTRYWRALCGYPLESRWSTGPSYSVDTEADLARVRRIYEAVGKDVFGLEDIEACQIA